MTTRKTTKPFLLSYVSLGKRCELAQSFQGTRGAADSAMKPGVGLDPIPFREQDLTHTGKSAREAGEPAKQRAHTVATFLCPPLPLEKRGDTRQQHSRAANAVPAVPLNLEERRNAIIGIPTGLPNAEASRLARGSFEYRGFQSASTADKASSRPGQTGSAFSESRQAGCSSRRLSARDRDSGGPRQHTNGAVARASGDYPIASNHSATSACHKLSVPVPTRRASQPAPRNTSDGASTICRSRTSQSTATSDRQTLSLQEAILRRRDAPEYRKDRTTAGTASDGRAKSREANNGKVGLTADSERGRQIPTSYFLSATRTKESLLVPGEGRAYHLGVQHGELYNRILTVGHAGRADWLAEKFLDSQMRTLSLKSNRNFRVHSGYYKRKPVSIVSFGMGAPMVDILVREASYITEGPLAIVRLGTCALLDQELRPGSIVVANPGSLGCYTNYAYFDGTAVEYSRAQELKPYTITRPCAADPELSRLIYRHAASQDSDSVFEGLNVSAETFYSCQAREDQLFRDENAELLETLVRCGAQTMDMETHQLLHLASRRVELMKAAAVHIGVISRTNDHFMHPITPLQLNELIAIAGRACLDALVDVTI